MDDIIELDFSKPELRKATVDAKEVLGKGNVILTAFVVILLFWVELPFWKEARPELNASKAPYSGSRILRMEHQNTEKPNRYQFIPGRGWLRLQTL